MFKRKVPCVSRFHFTKIVGKKKDSYLFATERVWNCCAKKASKCLVTLTPTIYDLLHLFIPRSKAIKSQQEVFAEIFFSFFPFYTAIAINSPNFISHFTVKTSDCFLKSDFQEKDHIVPPPWKILWFWGGIIKWHKKGP